MPDVQVQPPGDVYTYGVLAVMLCEIWEWYVDNVFPIDFPTWYASQAQLLT